MSEDLLVGLAATGIPLLAIAYLALRNQAAIFRMVVAMILIGLGYLTVTGAMNDIGSTIMGRGAVTPTEAPAPAATETVPAPEPAAEAPPPEVSPAPAEPAFTTAPADGEPPPAPEPPAEAPIESPADAPAGGEEAPPAPVTP